jgi:hypothetical protein
VNVTLVQTDGWSGGRARATVFAPSGTELVYFDANSARGLALEESGTYVVRVWANDLVSTGSHRLGIECIRPASPVEANLSCGSLVSTSIQEPGETDLFTFQGNAGTTVSVTLVQTEGWSGGRVRATVFSPSGTELVYFDANSSRTLALEESGTYVIRIWANDLVTVGSHNLGLECL